MLAASGAPTTHGSQYDSHQFGTETDVYAYSHILCGELSWVVAYVRLDHSLSEIIVGASEPAVETSSKGCFGPTAVGTGVTGSIVPDEAQQAATALTA